MLQYGWILKAWCQVKCASHKRTNTTWFHLYEVSKVVILIETGSRMVVARVWGREIWGVVVQWKRSELLMHDTTWIDFKAVIWVKEGRYKRHILYYFISIEFVKVEQQSIATESRSVVAWGQGCMAGKDRQEGQLQNAQGNISGVMNMFIILIVMVISCVCTYIKPFFFNFFFF